MLGQLGIRRIEVKRDATEAATIGVNGTPSFLINDYYLSGAQPAAAFRRLIKRALADAKKPATEASSGAQR